MSSLTPRERQCIDMLCQGMSHGDIARELGLGYQVVKNYVHIAYQKMGVHSRVQALRFAIANGWVQL